MHDVIIIGAGPAGLSAARWCDELGLDTLLLEEQEQVGGQLHRIFNPITNYLGVSAKDGKEMLQRFNDDLEGGVGHRGRGVYRCRPRYCAPTLSVISSLRCLRSTRLLLRIPRRRSFCSVSPGTSAS